MYREVLIVATMMFAATANAANFTGDPGLVAVAEKARVTSATFWTGKKLKDWPQPCPISWSQEGAGEGLSKFTHTDRGVRGFRVQVNGSREVVSKDTIPHEVDHMVRATVIGHPIPRWLDEGSAVQFETAESKAGYRSALLYGDLQNSVWDMFHLKEYPRNDDAMTAMYSGSASVVEWMIEMRGAKEVLKAQEYSLSTPQQWQMYVGEPISKSRQRYDEWFHQKYVVKSHPSAVPDDPVSRKDIPFADVYVAGDFQCDPCHQFLEYADHSRAGRKFDWKIHRISGDECRRNNISVPMFVVNGVKMNEDIRIWHDVDVWAAKQLGLGKPHMTAEESLQPVAPPEELPGLPMKPTEVAPGVTMTPEAIGAFSELMSAAPKQKEPDPSIDWSSVRMVIVLSDANPKITKAVKGPSLRAFKRLTGGDLSIDIVCEEDSPQRFDKYSESLGIDIDVFHVSLLIPSGSSPGPDGFIVQRVENLLNATASNFSREKILDIPVEIISEELDESTYKRVLASLEVPDGAVTDHSELIKYLAGPALGLSLWGVLSLFRKKKTAVVTEAIVLDAEPPVSKA